MFVKMLIYAKHHYPFIWYLIEWFNGYLFGLLYSEKIYKTAREMLDRVDHPEYAYRLLSRTDLTALEYLLNSQDNGQNRYFRPHKLDGKSLQKLFLNPSFLMMGVFEYSTGRMVGYFFLRFFLNRKGFIGRLVDQNYQRRGIATLMSEVMYQTLWRNDFRCLSTISRHNSSILKLHEREGRLKILKELPNDYLFVEIAMPVNDEAREPHTGRVETTSKMKGLPKEMDAGTDRQSGDLKRKKLKDKPQKMPKDHMA